MPGHLRDGGEWYWCSTPGTLFRRGNVNTQKVRACVAFSVTKVVTSLYALYYVFQDDYRVNLKYGIITKDMEPICPVDMSGRFDERVSDFKGQYVKVCRIYY